MKTKINDIRIKNKEKIRGKIQSYRKINWSRNGILGIALLLAISFSIVGVARAVTPPDPGHSWAETGDGTFQVTGPTALRTYTFPDADATILTSETDPVFGTWDKSTGISITESQISDLQAYLIAETDPVFTTWDKSTGISITESQISDLQSYLTVETDPVFIAQKGVANGVATLDADSKIPSSQLPALAISNTYVVADSIARDALSVETGDVAVQTDINKSYIFDGTTWQELLTPTDTVLSVNGNTGAVSLTKSDIGLSNVEDTALSGWVGSSNIVTLGTISSGIWNGNSIDLSTYATGDLPVVNLGGGVGASAETFWRGDGTWAKPINTSVTVQSTTTIAISNVSDTTLLTVPAITLISQPVKIFVSMQLENTAGSARNVTFKLFRNGVEVSVTDRYVEKLVTADDNVIRSFHFYDTPGTGTFTYSIRAIANNTGINIISNSRLTVSE